MNSNALKGKIVEHGMTVGEFCKRAGFVRSTFDRKMKTGAFSRTEIKKIMDTLDLAWEDTERIFFPELLTQLRK